MPTSFLSADAGFPRLTPDIPAEERLNRIQNYLYMLLEQLRYTLYNLGEENFNEESLKEIGEAIQEPVLSVVSDLAGNVSQISQTATAITTRLDNFNGTTSTIEQTATAISFEVYDPEGSVSRVTQTANSLTSRLNDFSGSGSTIEQTVGSINTAVFDPNGSVSQISQKADRIDWIVASGTSASNMSLTPEAIALIAQDINISGYVTFTSLETSGQSEINGNNVLLKADQYGDSTSHLEFLNSQDHSFGSLRTIDRTGSTNPYDDDVMFLIEAAGMVDGTYCGLRLNSGRSVVVDAGDYLNLVPGTQLVMNCGSHPVIIQADTVSYAAGWCPAGCYSFCDDGIYYGSTRIVAV